MERLRSRGLEAKARLDSRRRSDKDAALPAAKRPSAPVGRAVRAAGGQRRLNDHDKQAGVGRLRARMRIIERQLHPGNALRSDARAKLEDELAGCAPATGPLG